MRGDIRIDDLIMIFLALRELSKDRATIVEVGNFVAHRTERRHGLVTNETKDFFVLKSRC